MSTLSATNLKNASSGSNNIVLATDGSATIATLNSTTITGTSVRGGITSGTAVASTSGTSIDFTSIPNYVKRVTVMFNGVSTSGTSIVQVQLGTSSGVTTTGYAAEGTSFNSNSANTGAETTTGFPLEVHNPYVTAAGNRSGNLVFNNITGNTWIGSGVIGASWASGPTSSFVAGRIALSATLDRIRITTVNGTDTFDAGTINILYEG